ncbi:hypothetical protein K2X14_14545 [Acetobacter sp. TBRC 12305]|uniref:Uncharacterized protein n=1 Tax=Acetobacter garciniae TaxID=2817435 RepID=A0A939HQF9_9PROT|nr:hypothetical protein [Acetobacter garciniae]MBO1326208.1 hypothetical protein [Acetobacter garciniae]MBX0346055.1 hypothetical protein [Acetobacter garciniae]
MPFAPFTDDGLSESLDGLTLENGADSIALYGQIAFRKDQAGLSAARQLMQRMASIVEALEKIPDLPAKSTLAENTHPMANPFA